MPVKELNNQCPIPSGPNVKGTFHKEDYQLQSLSV